MGIVFKNNAKTTLASSLSNSATSASVADGSVFPTLGAGEFFLITFDDGVNNEICKCTARSSNTLTIVRAQDNTSARAFSSGDAAEGRVTAGVLETIQENIAAKSANQTVYNATTASSATAYDIGIDPGVEANAMVFLDGVMQHHDTFSFSGSTLTFDAAPTDGTKLEVIVDNLINLQSSNLTVDSFTAADVGGSAQTAFTLSDTPAAETNLIVFVDGVFQDQDAYTISSSTLTITTGVIAGRGVTVYVINPVNIGTPSDSTITSAKLSGNITMPGTLTVGANDVAFDSPTFVVDNSNSRVGLGTASPTVPVDIVGETKMSSHLNLADNAIAKFGAGSDLQIYHDGSNSYVKEEGTGALVLQSNGTAIVLEKTDGENMILANTDGDVKLYYNGSEKLATASGGATVTGTLTADALTVDEITINADTITATDDFILDVEGEIVLDANNGGQVQLKDNGTEYGRFFQDSNRLFIQSMVGDADILIRGVDGSSTFTALSFDMSEAGRASFNEGIRLSGLNGGTGLAFDMAGSGDYVIKESSTSDVMSFQGGLFHNFSSNNFGILASTPSRLLDVQLTATNGSLHNNNNAAVHFGSGSGNANSDGYIQGISLGYKTTGANTYAKVAIVARGLNDGAGRQSLAFLVDTDADGGSAEIGNAKLTIHGTTGNVGIGMPAPNANLEVFDASGGAGTGVRINCNNGGSDVWDLYSTTAGRLYVKNPNYSGGVYIQHGATSWTGNSDENLKENITSLGTVGDKLKNYRTSYFTWKDDNRETPKRQIGFIAQDWESDFPEVVNKMEGEPLGMQYTETIPILLKYIQELEARIETLEG